MQNSKSIETSICLIFVRLDAVIKWMEYFKYPTNVKANFLNPIEYSIALKEKCPYINVKYILTGEGDMIDYPEDTSIIFDRVK